QGLDLMPECFFSDCQSRVNFLSSRDAIMICYHFSPNDSPPADLPRPPLSGTFDGRLGFLASTESSASWASSFSFLVGSGLERPLIERLIRWASGLTLSTSTSTSSP